MRQLVIGTVVTKKLFLMMFIVGVLFFGISSSGALTGCSGTSGPSGPCQIKKPTALQKCTCKCYETCSSERCRERCITYCDEEERWRK